MQQDLDAHTHWNSWSHTPQRVYVCEREEVMGRAARFISDRAAQPVINTANILAIYQRR